MGLLRQESHDDQFDRQTAEAVSQFQNDLKQKDELISALIHELEQAVEQLDRYERVGADRTHSGQTLSLSNPSLDVSGLKLPFMDTFQQMVEDWEQAQPTSQLERIESKLAAVHDLVLSLNRTERPRHDQVETESHERRFDRQPVESKEDDIVNMTLDESSPSWDAIKNQLFGNVESTPFETQSAQSCAEDSELLQLMSETPTPKAVDFHSAKLEELQTAIVERDAYIIQLNRLFRTRNSLSLPTDWATLADVPAQMQLRVESLIEHLDVQVRLGEVEMSLERARLARERSQIQSEREHLDKHLRRLGLNNIAELDNISEATGSSGDRRWMRFLGPNTK